MNDALVRDLVISTALLGVRDTVELSVADTGHGVTAEVKERLFMPYFSTKQRGTGLGLAIVASIVEDHHGTIRVEENRPWARASLLSCRLPPKRSVPPIKRPTQPPRARPSPERLPRMSISATATAVCRSITSHR